MRTLEMKFGVTVILHLLLLCAHSQGNYFGNADETKERAGVSFMGMDRSRIEQNSFQSLSIFPKNTVLGQQAQASSSKKGEQSSETVSFKDELDNLDNMFGVSVVDINLPFEEIEAESPLHRSRRALTEGSGETLRSGQCNVGNLKFKTDENVAGTAANAAIRKQYGDAFQAFLAKKYPNAGIQVEFTSVLTVGIGFKYDMLWISDKLDVKRAAIGLIELEADGMEVAGSKRTISSTFIENDSGNLTASVCFFCEAHQECTKGLQNSYTCLTSNKFYFPFGPGQADKTLKKNSEFYTYRYTISELYPYGDKLYSSIYIGVNGLISLGEKFASFSSKRLPFKTSRLLAPFWADLDLASGDTKSAVYTHLYEKHKGDEEDKKMIKLANERMVKYGGVSSYDAIFLVVATWEGVPPFPAVNNGDERVSFQAAIVTDGSTTYAFMIYPSGGMNFSPLVNRDVNIGYGEVNLDITANYYVFDTVTGNTGEDGFWIVKLGERENKRAKCVNWYYRNLALYTESFIEEINNRIPACHCKRGSAEKDGFWVESDLAEDCYDNMPKYKQYGRRCCYGKSSIITKLRESGTMHMWTPNFGNRENHEEWDSEPKEWCCGGNSFTTCLLYYKIRPTRKCINARTSGRCLAFGDPHVQTLDGHQFMFNGVGEYILIDLKGERDDKSKYDYQLQARTCRAYSADGTITDATVWCGLAGKTTDGTKFSASLESDELVIYVAGQDYSQRFKNDPKFRALNGGVSVTRKNETLTIFAPENIGVEVKKSGKLLEFAFDVNLEYKGKLKGLLGDFDGNKENDLKYPDGRQIPNSSKDAEIFKLGQTWQVTKDNSVFTYRLGKSFNDYKNSTFVPIFLDETDAKTIEAAEKVCGGPGNLACIFDFVATKDESLAQATKSGLDSFANEEEALNNLPPVIEGDDVLLNTTVGQTSTFSLTASDPNKEAITFVIVTQPGNNQFTHTISGNTLTGKLTPSGVSKIDLSIVVKDTKDVESQTKVISISNCECGDNGNCDFALFREVDDSTAYYKVATCVCNAGYAGNTCDDDYDGCSVSPCPEGTNCTDIKASEFKEGNLPYKCSECPKGFTLSPDGSKCQDIDECKNTPCDKNAKCTNKIGSFFCTCNAGYREGSTANSCVDINECVENSNNCAQLCANTVGGYKCSCNPGFDVSGEGGNLCTKKADPCVGLNSGCQYGCINDNGTPKCFCQKGFKLADDGKKCENIDECSNKLCSQKCQDTPGSYTCSCFTGYTLSADKHSCTICPESYYGENCLKKCNCRGRATLAAKPCDNVVGCKCDPQWTGTFCNVDVDECKDPNKCPAGQICTNTNGGYTCTCPKGYHTVGESTKCVDIDECKNFALHKCPQKCRNSPGTFTCFCDSGYAYNKTGNTCDDIDECATGLSGCGHKCLNNVGSFNCECLQGFKLDKDRKTCLNAEEVCKGSPLKCSFACTLLDDKPQCICSPGYYLGRDNQTCVDVDECKSSSTNKCTSGCDNTPGSYKCTCPVGKKLASDERTCEDCDDSHWGPSCKNECGCDPIGTASCDKVTGCKCKSGWTGDTCKEDIDECNSNVQVCKTGSKCINNKGGYTCECNKGFELVKGVCTDIDECKASPCAQTCTNTVGSYKCSCSTGFTVNGDSCDDVDECAAGTHNCEQKCRNTQGSFACQCNEGFVLDTSTRERNKCKVDPNAGQCTSGHGCQGDQCIRKNSQNVCFCKAGYELAADKKTCQDINECTGGSNPCKGDGSKCQNIAGGFSCSCANAGTKLAADKITCVACERNQYGVGCTKSCTCDAARTTSCSIIDGRCTCQEGWTGSDCSEDVDECKTADCGANSNCFNTPGSYSCRCAVGYLFSSESKSCKECDSNSFGQDCKETCECVKENSKNCDKTDGACSCKTGWKGLTCNTNVNECTEQASKCPDARETCKDLPGSFECVCANGYTKVGDKCEDDNECITGEFNCEAPRVCSNTLGSYKCVCDKGYNETNSKCVDRDECEEQTFTCEANSKCVNTVGSYRCDCIQGYKKKGGVCTDIDECADKSHNCKYPTVCKNEPGKFTCVCDDGFSGSSDSCKDKDECALNTHTCKSPNVCNNTYGSFECICAKGFEKDGNNCADIDECAKNTHDCKSPAYKCKNTNGSFECICSDGYAKDKADTCVDVDECKTPNKCPANSKCKNNVGSFACNCDAGYTKDNDKCIDIDECKTGAHNCKGLRVCNNTAGTFECICGSGYKDIEGTCTDVDECKTPNKCPANSKCKNTVGSFACNCDAGYTKDNDKCVDIDECKTGAHNCTGLRECNNTAGTFECNCRSGYKDIEGTCSDEDECNKGLCLPPNTCKNKVGTYDCTCAAGFSKSGKNCVDDDECKLKTDNCTAPWACNNTAGSFQCYCPSGYKETDGKCTENFKEFYLNITFNFSPGTENNLTESLRISIEIKLNEISRAKIGKALHKLRVIRLRKGSVIADTSVQIDQGQTSAPATALVNVADTIANQSNLQINGENATVKNLNVNNLPYVASASACEKYNSVSGGCPSGFTCVERNSQPVCVEANDSDYELTVGLGVGIPLFLILCVLVAVCVYLYMKKRSTSGRNTPSEDRDAPYRSLFASKVAPKGSWGAAHKHGLYAPDAFSESGGSDSSSTPDQYIKSHQNKSRSDFQDSPWYDNHGATTSRGGNGHPSSGNAPAELGPPTSNFSWEYMFKILEPHRGFGIQRPNVSPSRPHRP